jgi:hypothetical protein
MEAYLKPVQIFAAASMAGDLTSPSIVIRNQDNVGIQLAWETEDAVGTFKVQISIDETVWTDIPLTATAASVDDNAFLEMNQTPAQFVRVLYTRTSGEGTVSAKVCAKGV